MTNLIRSELVRIWSRRMVRVLAILAVVGIVVGVTIGAIQSSKPDLVAAQGQYDADLQRCLAGEMIPEDQLPPDVTLEAFCDDHVQLGELREQLASAVRAAGVLEGDRVHPDRAGSDHRSVVRWGGLAGRDDGRALDLGTTPDQGLPGPGRGGGRVRVRAGGRPAAPCSRWPSRPPRPCVARRWTREVRGSQGSSGRCSGSPVPRPSARGSASRSRWSVGTPPQRSASRSAISRSWRVSCEDSSRRSPGSLLSTNLVIFVDGKAGTSETGSAITVGGAVLTITIYAVILLAIALTLFRTRDVT